MSTNSSQVMAIQKPPKCKNETASEIVVASLKEKILKNGYVTVNIKNLYYFTLGMSSLGRRDLFSVGYSPYSMFQIIADRYYKENWAIGTTYQINEFKIPALLMEPSRVRLELLDSETIANIKKFLAKIETEFDVDGFNFVSLPDRDNLLYGDLNTRMVKSPTLIIGELISAISKDMKSEKEHAMAVLKELG